MDNVNRFLAEKQLEEAARGGPARYRPDHLAPNPMARYLAEMRVAKAEGRHRLLRLRLPGLEPVDVRLPVWALVGRLSA
jgi:hypothetical protein